MTELFDDQCDWKKEKVKQKRSCRHWRWLEKRDWQQQQSKENQDHRFESIEDEIVLGGVGRAPKEKKEESCCCVGVVCDQYYYYDQSNAQKKKKDAS